MPLQSLSQIRASSSDSPSSSGGLKSLQDIRMQHQQQSLMKDYPQMVADEQNIPGTDSYNNARGAAEADEQWQIGQGQKNLSPVLPDATPQQSSENAQYADMMKQAYQNNPDAFQYSNRSLYANDPSRQLPVIGPILRGLDAFGNNSTVEKAADIGRSFYVPGASAANIAGFAGAAEAGLAKLAPSLADSAAGKLAADAIAPGLAVGAGGELYNNPEATGWDLAKGAIEGGATGLGLGLAGKAIGAGLGALADRYAGTKIGDALGRLTGRSQQVTPEAEQQMQGMLALPAPEERLALPPASTQYAYDRPIPARSGTVDYPSGPAIEAQGDVYNPQPLALPPSDYVQPKLSIKTGNDYLDSVLTKIKPEVEQAMTVPTRRDLLVNYIENHLQVPREEIHNMPTTDLQELGQHIRDNLSVYDIATQAAAKHGYDLPAILEGKTPSISSRVAEDAQKRVYGIYPESLPELQKPESFARSVTGEAAAPMQKGFRSVKQPENIEVKAPVRKFAQTPAAGEAERLQSLSEINAGAQESRLKSPSEIKSAQPDIQRIRQVLNSNALTPNERLFVHTANGTKLEVQGLPIGRVQPHEVVLADGNTMDLNAISKITDHNGKVLYDSGNVKSGLNSPSEIKESKQVEALNAEVKPEPRLRDKIVDYMDKQAAAAQERINARRNIGFIAPVGNDAIDHAIIGAAYIVKHGVQYADFSEMMIRHYGNQIKPYIPGIYKTSVDLAKKNGKMTKKDLRRSYNFDQFNRNNLDTTIPDTRGQIVSKVKSNFKLKDLADKEFIKKAASNAGETAYIKNIDNLHSMNKLSEAAEKLTGKEISPEDNPHTLALNTRSNDMIAHQIINKGLVDAKGKVITGADGNPIGSLKDITKQIPKNQYNEFMDYLVNKHAVDRMNRGEKVFDDNLKMSPEKSAEIVRRYDQKYPEFKKIADQYHNFMNKFGQAWLVDTGRIPQDVWDAYRHESPNYVPNFREMNELEKRQNFGGGKQSFSGQGSGVQEAKGSGRKIIDPIESTIELISKNVKGAKKNEVMQALGRVLEKNPEGLKGFAEAVKEPEGQKPPTKKEILQKLHEEGLEGFLKQEDDSFQNATSKPDLTKGNIVPYMKDGIPQHIKVNDVHLLDAISNMEPKSQGVIIEGLSKMTKVMKTLTTGINPVFSFTRNIAKDIPDAFKNSTTTNNPVKFLFDLGHAAVSAFGDGELARSYKNMGGGHAGHVSASRNLLAQSKNNILSHEGAANTLMYALKKAWHNFENFNSALETAPRLAEYKRTVQQGGNTYASRVQGLANANDITVNFNRHGQVSKEIDKVFPYYNAAIQGLDKTIRSYKDNPVQATLKSVAAITLPAMYLYYINHNDPNYQKLSAYTKDNYFLFPKGDGTFIKVPKPREAGFLFGTMIEQSLAKWKDHDPTAFKNFGEYIKNVFAPPGISGMIDTQSKSINPLNAARDSIIGPGVDVLMNKDFMDRPIVPQSLQGLSPKMQYNQNTSEIGKGLAKLPFNNLSPMQIDYLLKSYGGVLGQVGLPLATKGKSLGAAMNQQVTADPTYSNDISQDFYNAKTQYDQQKADAKAQGKVSSTIGMDSYLDKMATVVSQLHKQILSIQNNPNMADADKQVKIEAMQLQMNNLQQQALNSMQKFQQKAK